MMDSTRKSLLDFYESKAPTWHIGHGDIELLRQPAELFNEHLLPGSKLVDIGCATGRDTALLRSMGHDCLGVDFSPKMVEEARRHFPEAKFEVADIYELADRFPRQFDGFWAHASLLHVPKEDMEEVLVSFQSILKLAGVGSIALKEGDGQLILDDGRLFCYWREDEFWRVLSDSGYGKLSFLRLEDKLGRKDTSWMYFFVQAING